MAFWKANIVLLIFMILKVNADPVPIVMWHGMGDACCMPYSLGPFMKFLSGQIPGVYIKSIMLGDNVIEDVENSYFLSPNKQVSTVCKQLSEDQHLRNGFHALGFSQGSQFLRGVIQRCGHRLPKIRNFVSLGGQHQGVYGVPNCGSLKHTACKYIRKLLNYAAYVEWVQHALVQATYWHDPLNEGMYRERSEFLADINNENKINSTYIKNLKQLENFVMVKFENDTIVDPVETEWFGFYAPGQDKKLQSLQDSAIYLQDRLGLRQMDNEGKVVFLSTPGDHLKFSEEWFIKNVLKPYLQ